MWFGLGPYASVPAFNCLFRQATLKTRDIYEILKPLIIFTDDDLDHLAQSVYTLVQTQDQAVQEKVTYDLNVARHIIDSEGGLDRCSGRMYWTAINQFTRETVGVNMPRMCIGETWLGQDRSLSIPTPIVDTVANLVGGAATIFQRMNDEGDILRVATNVPKSEFERVIETYIPAISPDGTPNSARWRSPSMPWRTIYTT